MKKIQFIILLAVFCFTLQVPLFAQPKDLVIYTWEEMFPEEILAAFERDNPDLKIVYKTFEENEEMLDELIRTQGGEYDLVIADDYIVGLVTHPNFALAQKLDKNKISNIYNVDYFYQYQFYDPLNEYTIPYGAGIQTILYDPARIKLDVKGYADLWHSSLRNRVGIIGNYRVINGMALKTLGKHYNTGIVADISNAGDRLKSLVTNLRYIKEFGLEEDLIEGRISIAVMYSDMVTRARQARPDLKVVYPNEGIGFGILPAFIPVNAPNPDGAHRFLEYILDPERGAQCFEYVGYYCTFSGSREHIDPELLEFLTLPDLHSFEMIENIAQDAEDEHFRIWSEFMSAFSSKPIF
ncbi:MAG: spermidine/putrescine ABC transporter substrate-binding protein [Treponema sp.]|jgi:spermidine/putrescine-binding protein|nr:spermidine/putrescine ABC transporter substrate-binding protein [Treponema sp.]